MKWQQKTRSQEQGEISVFAGQEFNSSSNFVSPDEKLQELADRDSTLQKHEDSGCWSLGNVLRFSTSVSFKDR